MSEELKSTQIYYGENVLMIRVDDCLIFGNKDALRRLAKKLEGQKKGKWIPVDSGTVNGRCSVCGYESHLYENDVYGEHYCPHCGADLG